MSMTVRQADAWDVHPTGRVVILLDPPYGLNKDTWDTKDNARKFYSTKFLKSVTSDADAAVVIIFGYDDMLIPLASEMMSNKSPHWRYCNIVTFVPDRPRQGMNHDVHHRLPRNSKALILHYVRDPLFAESDIVKETFPESMRPALNFMRDMAASRGYTTKDLIRLTGVTTCSHYLQESEFEFPRETSRFLQMFPDATDEELQAYREARQAYMEARQEYREARQAYREARSPFRNCMTSDAIPYVLDQHRDDTYGHPTAKQVGELRPLIEFTQKSWLVVDPFCGSGMTAQVCDMLGRDCDLSDIDTRWVEATQHRIDQMKGN